jgi:hypothetical protein
MLNRERQLGFCGGKPDGLIAGVKVNDGIHFPDFAKISQYVDFEALFFDGPGFAKSELYIELQKKIAALALDVARLISKVPSWSPDWLTPAWTDDVIARIGAPVRPRVLQPILVRKTWAQLSHSIRTRAASAGPWLSQTSLCCLRVGGRKFLWSIGTLKRRRRTLFPNERAQGDAESPGAY